MNLDTYFFLIGTRKQYVEAIKSILATQPTKIRKYDNTYYGLSGIKGDAAYIVDRETFLMQFTGFKRELKFALSGEIYDKFIAIFGDDLMEQVITKTQN